MNLVGQKVKHKVFGVGMISSQDDEELIKQELSMMICETCTLSDSCPGPGLCLLPKGAKKKQVDSMYKFLKESEEKKR